jgi:hypothetical protein
MNAIEYPLYGISIVLYGFSMDTSGCFQPFTTCGMHRNGDGVLQLDAWTVGVKLLCVMDVVVLKRCAFTNRIVCFSCKYIHIQNTHLLIHVHHRFGLIKL